MNEIKYEWKIKYYFIRYSFVLWLNATFAKSPEYIFMLRKIEFSYHKSYENLLKMGDFQIVKF